MENNDIMQFIGNNMKNNIVKTQLTFQYHVKNDSINSITIANSILSVNQILVDINKEYNKILNSNHIFELKIKPFEKKCFKEIFEIIGISQPILTGIFNINNIEYVKLLSKTFIKLLDLKKFLKGGKAVKIKSEGDHSILTNIDGNNNSVHNNIYHIYSVNPNTEKNLAELVEHIKNDNEIEDFEVTDENEQEKTIINKLDFPLMSQSFEELNLLKNKIPREDATINLRVNLKHKKRLQFAYEGNEIDTDIEDEAFISTVENGEKLANGDKIIANIDIEQVFDEKYNTYINKKMIIKKVKNHIPRNDNQEKIF